MSNSRYILEQHVEYTVPPGGFTMVQKGTVLKTLLGSCVSILFYHPPTKTTMLSHAMLPHKTTHNKLPCKSCIFHCDQVGDEQFRYVTCAIKYMVDLLKKLYIPQNEVTVKLFGGAKTLALTNSNIGEQNILQAHKSLSKLGLRIKKEDTGGVKGRIIYVNTHNGEVFIRKA